MNLDIRARALLLLRNIRQSRGLTLASAARLGIDSSYLSLIETGKRPISSHFLKRFMVLIEDLPVSVIVEGR